MSRTTLVPSQESGKLKSLDSPPVETDRMAGLADVVTLLQEPEHRDAVFHLINGWSIVFIEKYDQLLTEFLEFLPHKNEIGGIAGQTQ